MFTRLRSLGSCALVAARAALVPAFLLAGFLAVGVSESAAAVTPWTPPTDLEPNALATKITTAFQPYIIASLTIGAIITAIAVFKRMVFRKSAGLTKS